MQKILKTVLTVENDKDFRAMLVEIIGSLGYNAIEAKDAREGIGILQKQTVDLMLLDIHMPGPRGTILLKYLRDKGHQIPVIVISGYLQKEVFEEIRERNVQAVLTKPISVKRLTDEIHKVFGEGEAA
ncbi:MAG: response regulator [Candidatus Latescibacteria bacterium]|nr:response regulator [Candidatus Latescibacterota bacterium]